MKTVCKENMCCACGACVEICPVNAITLSKTLFFNNAYVNENCINCHCCERVCQRVHPEYCNAPIEWFQGWADDLTRSNSTSGGVATAVCKSFILNGGVVCSCVQENGDFHFSMHYDVDSVAKSAGSKYVKSDVQGILKKIKNLLVDEKKVLFIGLPCQVAAIKKFVGKSLEKKLYTIDIICHGTPSKLLLERFIGQFGKSLSDCKNVSFRDGNKYRVAVDGKSLTPRCVLDTYTLAFVNGLSFTENCYSCDFAKFERVSDLTLGDAWGSTLPKSEIDKGISLMLCQTEKGKELLLNSGAHMEPVDVELVKLVNHQLTHPVRPGKNRKLFVNAIMSEKTVDASIMRIFPMIYIKQKIKQLLHNLQSFFR